MSSLVALKGRKIFCDSRFADKFKKKHVYGIRAIQKYTYYNQNLEVQGSWPSSFVSGLPTKKPPGSS